MGKKKVTLEDHERLNRGARPVGYLKMMPRKKTAAFEAGIKVAMRRLEDHINDLVNKTISESPKNPLKHSLLVKHPVLMPVVGAALLGGGSAAGLALAMGKKGREQVGREVRDPRLYSNIRGMVSGESAEERVKAHKKLERGDGTISGAMRRGWRR